ncbi:anti-phage protein KwaB [Epilithonimonas vandammei]|uniref:anti-phage protein KwaB n=1 Tax=Epilithonimonas vandammei TaxID=2487072 RepID=UPI0028A6C44B|nr:anti-phage protein KwaB [Epilithonimonas vandammei]
MNIGELRGLLDVINREEPVGIQVHVVLKNESDQETIMKADVSEELAEELKNIFIGTINERFFHNEDLVLSNISDANELIDSAFYYDINEFPDKLEIVRSFNPWENYNEFSFRNDDIADIKAILITLGNQNSHFTIFKHVYPITILKQDRVIRIFPSSHRFEKFNDTILQINETIDFIYAENSLIVNNLKTLTNAYGYKEVIKNQARIKIEIIRTLDLIENLDELHAFVENVKYAKRMLKISPNSPVISLDKMRIINFIRNHPKLASRIRLNNSGERIVLDTDVSKVHMIGILNDDFLKSNLTDIDYESERKAELLESE